MIYISNTRRINTHTKQQQGISMKLIGLAVFIVLVLSGCNEKRELSPQEIEEVNALKVELEDINQQISAANAENDKYGSGLIKTLINTRTEALKLTKTLIDQRIKAIEYGAPIEQKSSSIAINKELGEPIKAEMEQLQSEIDAEQSEADRYTGGLIRTMKLASIATKEQSMAMLQHQYIMATYGIYSDINAQSANQKNDPEDKNIIVTNTDTVKPVSENRSPVVPKMPPADGPFGFAMGLTLDDMKAMTGDTPELISGTSNKYVLSSAPKPNGSFTDYVITVGNTTGLCAVRGIGGDIATNGFGMQLQSKFDDLSALLTEIYGNGDKTDSLLPGSIWKDADEWMMGLLKKDRYLISLWRGDDKPLPNDLQTIALAANAKNSRSGYLLLEYEFTNSDECSNESKDAEKKSL